MSVLILCSPFELFVFLFLKLKNFLYILDKGYQIIQFFSGLFLTVFNFNEAQLPPPPFFSFIVLFVLLLHCLNKLTKVCRLLRVLWFSLLHPDL